MILRPVSPVSPCGPPMTKRPVGLIEKLRRAVDHRFRQHLRMIFSMQEFLNLGVADVFGVTVEMTTLEMPTGFPLS
jgi:hypothetical protein